jgi:hypothetical protein
MVQMHRDSDFINLFNILSMALQPFVGPWPLFFSFLIFYTVGRTPLTGDQAVPRPLSAQTTTQTQNKRTQTSMPKVGFEPTIPVSEQVKTFHALDQLLHNHHHLSSGTGTIG